MLVWVLIVLIFLFIIGSLYSFYKITEIFSQKIDGLNNQSGTNYNYSYSNSSVKDVQLDTKLFNILASEEMKDVTEVISNYAKQQGYNVNIDYAGTLEIMEKIDAKAPYDAVWAANSIWTYMVDSNNATLSNSKITSISPIVFGIKKSKAEELGFIGKRVYTKDLLDAISAGKLKFAMSNPNTTNSGASAYLGMLYTFAGNPEVLTEEILNDVEVKSKMKSFFAGVERTSGTEDYLEELFLNGDYESVFSYESSIININKKLIAQGKEPLYIIYPFDGVPISDNPFVYVDHKDDKKQQIFLDIQKYLLSSEGKELIQKTGRRTWYGGINTNVDTSIFNEDWGVDTKEYITPVKYPTSDVIIKALAMYQTQYRKPVHVVFCLDYSGSMVGDGIKQLRAAMEFILSDAAVKHNIQFAEDDIIDVIPFTNMAQAGISTNNGTKTQGILDFVNSKEPKGGTNIYDACIMAIDKLKNEDTSVRNISIILMTDGESNSGKLSDLERAYGNARKDIPVYSIMFGDANDVQLLNIARLTNGKVFDGKTDLVEAFKEVRGYN